jgi:hypothetical protein
MLSRPRNKGGSDMAREHNAHPFNLTRREMMQLMAGVTGAGLLSACAPTAPTASQPSAPAAPQAAAVDSVVPKAASGALTGEVVLGIAAGPEADAHTRLAPKFAELTSN